MKKLLLALLLAPIAASAADLPYALRHRKDVTVVDESAVDPNQQIQVRVWLNFRPGLKALADDILEDPNPTRRWLSHEEFKERFAPLPEKVDLVRAYLERVGLTIVSVDPDNLWVTAKGSAANVQAAFTVEMRNYRVDGRLVRANTAEPTLSEDLADTVALVGGLNDRSVKHHTLAAGNYTNQCFHPLERHELDGTIKASYTGMRFVADPQTQDAIALSSCGYDPATLQTAYGLKDLHNLEDTHGRKLTGEGETVVIINGYGSPSIQEDLAAFTRHFGLPPAQLTIYQPGGALSGAWNADQQDWAKETTLDVEMAHVVAPGANLALVATSTDGDDEPISGLYYAIENHLGNVVSLSWGSPETWFAPTKLALVEGVLQSAVVQGIAVQAASGDSGDYYNEIGKKDVSYPASSPYITGVGGTMLAVNADGTKRFETGWGDNEIQLSSGSTPLAKPEPGGTANPHAEFQAGSGGGTSGNLLKPHYQDRLDGAYRKVPDIAYLADSFTGAQILISQFDAQGNPTPGNQIIRVQGGTSLATPMFSAIWAIADQLAGRSLGIAAPALYRLPKDAIQDVLPIPGELASNDVTATVNGAALSASQLVGPGPSASFLSTLFFSPVYGQPISTASWYVLTFGTDSSLATAPGWDDVTGLGVPNGKDFVEAAAALFAR